MIQPIAQPESDFYWENLKKEKIFIQRSKDSKRFQFFPRQISINNPNEKLEWVEVSGEAELYTFSIVYVAPHKNFIDHVPYISALVKLKEGVIIPTNIVNVEPKPENLAIGMKLSPVFIHKNNQPTLLKFEPQKTKEITND